MGKKWKEKEEWEKGTMLKGKGSGAERYSKKGKGKDGQ